MNRQLVKQQDLCLIYEALIALYNGVSLEDHVYWSILNDLEKRLKQLKEV